MKLLFILLISSCSFFCKAQNFAKIGAQWYYLDLNSPIVENPNLQNFIFLESVKDTLILKKMCKKVNRKFINIIDGTETETIPYFFLSENNKVYFYNYNKFNLLYDFDAQVGDTIRTYDSNFNAWDNPDTIGLNYVDSIIYDSTSFTNSIRKVFLNHWVYVSIDDFSESYHGPVIENIGGEKWILTTNDFTNSNPTQILFCYYEEGDEYVRKHEYCDIWRDYIYAQKSKEKLVNLYPNPISSNSKLVFPNPDKLNTSVNIYNLLGEKIYSDETIYDEFIISNRNFSAGIYIYQLIQDDVLLATNKFIVE